MIVPLTFIGTGLMVAAVTGTFMLWCSESERGEHWDKAVLAGLSVFLVVLGPVALVDASRRGVWAAGLWFASTELAMVTIAWTTQLALEDSVIKRPETVDAVPKRWPNWISRGFGVQNEE